MRRHALFFWGFVTLSLSVLFFVTKSDPFFGDSISTISRSANLIYESNFTEISYPQNLDPGHPITFPMLHALVWRIFGKALWVSHLFNLLFGLFTVMLFVRWGERLGFGHSKYVGGVLLLVTPLFVSQMANPNMHLPLTFFALGFVYSLSFGKLWHQIVFAAGLMLTHLQGLYYLTPIWIWWFASQNQTSFSKRIGQSIKILWIPGALFLAWLIYHYSITGWYLSSPDYAGHRGFPGFKRFIVNLVMADWRIVDYGQIALWILPVYAVIKNKIEWTWKHPMSLFLLVFLFNAIAIGMTTKTGPMHRYLLPCLPFLVMVNVSLLKGVSPVKYLALLFILISGHFWFYPGKVMGDATLSYRSIFPLLETAKQEYQNPPFYTYAPLSNPSTTTKLTGDSLDYIPLYNVQMDSVPYIIFSNISGDFSPTEIETLKADWPSKTYQKGYVYLEIYSNPNLVIEPLSGPKRKPSRFETWFIELKRKIKGDSGV